jgi:hypothetical protein
MRGRPSARYAIAARLPQPKAMPAAVAKSSRSIATPISRRVSALVSPWTTSMSAREPGGYSTSKSM